VKDCMVLNPTPWPQEWQQEYIETIRQAAIHDPNAFQYDRRLHILKEGFALYWSDLKNTQDRSHFEVRRAEIRWYVENLMAAELPGGEDTVRERPANPVSPLRALGIMFADDAWRIERKTRMTEGSGEPGYSARLAALAGRRGRVSLGRNRSFH
jgi:hypothetical protein